MKDSNEENEIDTQDTEDSGYSSFVLEDILREYHSDEPEETPGPAAKAPAAKPDVAAKPVPAATPVFNAAAMPKPAPKTPEDTGSNTVKPDTAKAEIKAPAAKPDVAAKPAPAAAPVFNAAVIPKPSATVLATSSNRKAQDDTHFDDEKIEAAPTATVLTASSNRKAPDDTHLDDGKIEAAPAATVLTTSSNRKAPDDTHLDDEEIETAPAATVLAASSNRKAPDDTSFDNEEIEAAPAATVLSTSSDRKTPDDTLFDDEEIEAALKALFGNNEKNERKAPDTPRRKNAVSEPATAVMSKSKSPEENHPGAPAGLFSEYDSDVFSKDIFNQVYEQKKSEKTEPGDEEKATVRPISPRLFRPRLKKGEEEDRLVPPEAGEGAEPEEPETPPVPAEETPVDPEKMIADLSHAFRSISARIPVAFLLCLPLVYLACYIPLKLPMPSLLSYIDHPFMHVLTQLIFLCAVAMVGLDIITNGIYDLFRLHPGGDSLIAISCIASALHCATVIFFPKWGGYLPVCVLPALSVSFSLLGDRQNIAGRLLSLRTACRADNPDTLLRAPDTYEGNAVYIRTCATDMQKFYRAFNSSDMVAHALSWYTPLALIVPLIMSASAAFSQDSGGLFFWAYAVTTAIVPVFGLYICCSAPYLKAVKKIFKRGAVPNGYSGLMELSKSGYCIVTDRDLFPTETVKINGYKILAPIAKEKAVSYTASVLKCAGSVLAEPFMSLLSSEYIKPAEVSAIEFSANGGIRAEVEGNHVMVGTAGFMRKAGLTVPDDIHAGRAVFCSVNMELVCVFSVKYQFLSRIDRALNVLVHGKRFPVLASRDFNVTEEMLEERFIIKSGSIIIPDTEIQVALANPDRKASSNSVLLMRDGLDIQATVLEAARRYAFVVRFCTVISIFASALGMLLLCVMTFNGWTATATPINMLLYSFAFTLPVFLLSSWINKF